MLPTATILLLAITSATGKLELRNIQPCHGALGPVRASDDVVPLDEYVVRYQIVGVKVDKDGKTDLEVAVRLTAPDGKVLLERKTLVQRLLSLGGNTLQTAGSIAFPEKAPFGTYTLSVAVRDRLGKRSASFERKLTCKAPEFQVLTPRFFQDEEMKVAGGMTRTVGEALTFRVRVVGFDNKQKKVGLLLRTTVVEATGKEIGAKPIVANGDITDADKAARTNVATFTGSLALHRPGDYRVRITIEDTIAKKTTTFEAPLRVVAP